jgi:hypothetical protein
MMLVHARLSMDPSGGERHVRRIAKIDAGG